MTISKRIFALVLCLCLLFGSCSAFAKSYYARQIAKCNEYVNMRAKPDTKSKTVDQVYIGEVVVATRYNSTYSYCCYNGKVGYIPTKYLSSKIKPYSEGTFYVKNCKKDISMRKYPAKGAGVVAKSPKGAKLSAVYYHDGGYTPGAYVYVKYKGKYGFVLWDYLAPKTSKGVQ